MKPVDFGKFLVLFVSITAIALAGIFVWLWVVSPSDGARLQPGEQAWQAKGIVVTPLFETPGGLQAGDVVIAVDGQGVESLVHSLFQPGAERLSWRAGQSVHYTVLRGGQSMDMQITLRKSDLSAIFRQNWGSILTAIIDMLVVSLVFIKRPDNPHARVLFLTGACFFGATTWSFGLRITDLVQRTGFWIYQATTYVAYTLVWIGSLHFALIFPRPQRIIRQSAWVIPLLYILPFAVHLVYIPATWTISANALDFMSRSASDVGFIQAIYLSLTLVAAVSTYRSARDTVSRLQVRWLFYALALVAILMLILGMLPEIILGYPLVSWDGLALIGLLVPVALAVAILRFHLFDIDILINRTLVYGALTTVVAAIYVLIVGLSDALFIRRGAAGSIENFASSLLAAALIAVVFLPLRERLQSWINRRMYGERDDPYTALSTLSNRLKSTLDPDSVLPTVVETVARTMKLPYAAIALRQGEEFNLAAEFGLMQASNHRYASCETFPLIYQAETVGQLILAQRGPDEAFNSADRRLIATIADQTGMAIHAIRLTADLQRSRERLVNTREEERRRMRRDLHDGLGSALASLSFNLDAARNLLKQDPGATEGLLAELKTQTQVAIADIRRLINDLRPPALDELGLVPALRQHIDQINRPASLSISLQASDDLSALPAAVEVASYRIILEALTNIIRHANAQHCTISLFRPDPSCLAIEIVDDGQGFLKSERSGIGISTMRERTEELGGSFQIEANTAGGTRVSVKLPLMKSFQRN